VETKTVVTLRKQAESAVADMPDGELKTKAFQVILERLLGAEGATTIPSPTLPGPKEISSSATKGSNPTSCVDRLLLLKAQGFFQTQKRIADVREELGSRGWHYPVTSLSGPLQTLVQRGELRRMRVKEGGKEVWKYSLP
jgi:hypothetical protein